MTIVPMAGVGNGLVAIAGEMATLGDSESMPIQVAAAPGAAQLYLGSRMEARLEDASSAVVAIVKRLQAADSLTPWPRPARPGSQET